MKRYIFEMREQQSILADSEEEARQILALEVGQNWAYELVDVVDV